MLKMAVVDRKNGGLEAKCLHYAVLVIVVLGAIGNVLLFISLTRLLRSQRLTVTAGRFLRIQAAVDAICCLLLFVVPFNDPDMPLPDADGGAADFLVCHVWYSQFPLWFASLCSVYNLLLLTFDRCVAIRLPMQHRRISKRATGLWTVSMAFCFVFSLPLLFFTELDVASSSIGDNLTVVCVTVTSSWYRVYCFWWVAVDYLIPSTVMVVSYVIMIRTLMRNNDWGELQVGQSAKSSVVKQRATRQLIKIVVIAGSAFILCFLQDNVVAFLSAFSITDYVLNSPLQILGALWQGVNFAINPFVIFCVMPLTRAAFTNRRKIESTRRLTSAISGSSHEFPLRPLRCSGSAD